MSHFREPGDIERHTLAAFDPHHLRRAIVEDDNDPLDAIAIIRQFLDLFLDVLREDQDVPLASMSAPSGANLISLPWPPTHIALSSG